jgi:ABC transporter substrate binding protein (PQQ-dependent alcohol dehydrogenase system)
MISKLARRILFGIALSVATAASPIASAAEIRIVVVEREDDPFYDEVDSSDGLYRVQAHRPFAGAEIGIKDVAPLGLAANSTFVLERVAAPPDEPISDTLRRVADSTAAAILLDLPVEDFRQAAKALPAGLLPMFNIRQDGDDLRRDLCGTDLFHVLPSLSARMDALAQFVVKRNWRRVLILMGPQDQDAVMARTFEASAKKFGARIVDTRAFVEGNDPRQRDQTNVALLTGGADYDALFVADTTGDFGRFVEFRAVRPRPVLGTEGLKASAWHFTSERYGAPQLSRRFERLAGRPMTSLDWSAWASVRIVGEVVARSSATTGAEILRRLRDTPVAIELSKGVTGSFRPWDQQLRQPIMLHTHNAVIEFAPLEGFLHERSTLDTLGLGPRDVPCGSR